MPVQGAPIAPLLYTWRVHFDPAACPAITFPDGEIVDVTTSFAVIALRLETAPGAESAQLLIDPIVWTDVQGEPVPAPPCMIVQRTSDRTVALLDTNVDPGPQAFQFAVSLDYQGRVFTSKDPAIINKDIPDFDLKELPWVMSSRVA